MVRAAWSALVYARTHEVDFRFIATPPAFAGELPTLEQCVLTTTRVPETLAGSPRWSLVRTAGCCVFGATCSAGDLVAAAANPDWQPLTRDKHGRALYVFVGYVGAPDAPVPPYAALNLALVAPLYRYVAERWSVQPYAAASRTPIEVAYALDLSAESSATQPPDDGSELARIRDELPSAAAVYFIPHTDHARKAAIWNSAAAHPGEIALCLGLSRVRDALHSPLHLASAPVEREGVVAPPPPAPKQANARASQPEAAPSAASPERHPPDKHRQRLATTIDTILGGNVSRLPAQMIAWVQEDLTRAPRAVTRMTDDTVRGLWKYRDRFFKSLSTWMQPGAPPQEREPPPRTPPPQPRISLKKSSRPQDTPPDEEDDRESPWNL
jgi:hypothetical protein